MDRPPTDIQFATTDDGLGIAFWEIGSGPPVVYINSLSFSHAELEWTVPRIAALYHALAQHVRLIRLDPRGSGLSGDPEPGAFQLDWYGLDVEAVTRAIGLESFTFLVSGSMGPAGIKYAATHDEVDRLILADTFAVTATAPLAGYMRAQAALGDVGADSVLVANTAPPEVLEHLEPLFTTAIHDTSSAAAGLEERDAVEFLPDIDVPTLVVKSRNSIPTDNQHARQLVTGIAGAQMRIVDGNWFPFLSDVDEAVEVMTDFLGVDRDLPPASTQAAPTQASRTEVDAADAASTEVAATEAAGLRTVVFTDLVSSTEVLSELGDEQGRASFRKVENEVERLASAHHGRLIKHLGDGSMVSFTSTRQALSFGLEVQRAVADGPLALKVGMAAGEPIQEDGDIHGAVVVQASRIVDRASAGEVLVSDAVKQLAAGKGFRFESLGEVSLKGLDATVPLWRVVA